MEIYIDRAWKKPGYTISRLFVNGSKFNDGKNYCSILEDFDRGLRSDMSLAEISNIKVKGKTAIPTGTYKVIINYSNRFRKNLPLLLNVPGFDGIRIHSGNDANDTNGCLLPGHNDRPGWVSNSRYWSNLLQDKIQDALNRGESVTIKIV